MADAKCGHNLCKCHVAIEGGYCADNCKQQTEQQPDQMPNDRCRCGHQACLG